MMCGLAKAFPLGAMGIASRLMKQGGGDNPLGKTVKATNNWVSKGGALGYGARNLFGD